MNKKINPLDIVSILPQATRGLNHAMASPAKAIGVYEPRLERSQFGIGQYSGEITPQGCVELRDWFNRMMKDDTIREVVLHMNSPGGVVTGVPETFEFGYRLAQKKKFTVLAEGVLASAGYWIAASATKLIASPSCLVGSCGVVSVLFDDSELFAAAGIRVIPVATGDAKSAGCPGVPITDSDIARVQRLIRETETAFKRDLRRAGRMTAQEREDAFMESVVFHAEAAKQRGFIDKVMIPEDFFAKNDEAYHLAKFTSLSGEAACNKFESLVMKADGVDNFWETSESTIKKVQASYPGLSEARDKHKKSPVEDAFRRRHLG